MTHRCSICGQESTTAHSCAGGIPLSNLPAPYIECYTNEFLLAERDRLQRELNEARADLAARPLNPSAVFVGFLQDQVAILKSHVAAERERAEKAEAKWSAEESATERDYQQQIATLTEDRDALQARIARLIEERDYPSI